MLIMAKKRTHTANQENDYKKRRILTSIESYVRDSLGLPPNPTYNNPKPEDLESCALFLLTIIRELEKPPWRTALEKTLAELEQK